MFLWQVLEDCPKGTVCNKFQQAVYRVGCHYKGIPKGWDLGVDNVLKDRPMIKEESEHVKHLGRA